ncbi:MAG: methylamine utilization protein [Rhizobiaceae bacterium]|nr:methylamine utilization protein [Rhizobiaceae bacterium]
MTGRWAAWLCGGALALLVLTGCGGESFTDDEKAIIASLSLSALPPLPPDPTNRYADDPAAAALGATLFFDSRMSPSGTVSCSTCHLIDRQFQDDLPLAKGVATGNRRTMPLAGVAWSPWLFWDGRRDSLWAQALTPLEDLREHAGTRAFYAHFIADSFAERYERIFGALPDLSGVPGHAGPFGTAAEQAAWAGLPAERQDEVNRVFANIGKAIAAFERSIVPEETRFDRFAAALTAGREPDDDATLTPEEIAGLKLFIGKATCSTCHTGPRLTDDSFHNTGVPPVDGLPEDLGRETGVDQVAADPFNCFGKYADSGPEACGELRFMVKDDPRLTRAFKPPSLRGAASRSPYMHSGQIETLEAVVDHYARAPASVSGETELHPLTLSERERQQLIAFLKTLTN